MPTRKLNRQGRPKGDSEQRSIRVPERLWPILERICAKHNRRRDPLIDGKWTPSTLINMALRDWLIANGHSTSCYLSVEEEEGVAA